MEEKNEFMILGTSSVLCDSPPFPGRLRAVLTLSPLVFLFIRKLLPFQVFLILLKFVFKKDMKVESLAKSS